MLELMAVFLFAGFPALLGFLTGVILKPKRLRASCLAVSAAAGVPVLLVLLLSQQGNSITAAAAYALAPIIFAIELIPAWLGLVVARRIEAPDPDGAQ